jgi:isopenicillin N synthase-like dioxygenase
MHRVVNPPRDQAIGSRRQSLVFFHQPNYDAVIECIPTCTETAPKYARTTSIEHLEMKMNQMNDTPKFKENEAA